MTQQVIDFGSGPNTQTGDTAYAAFTKVNANFAELYALPLGATGPTGPTGAAGTNGTNGATGAAGGSGAGGASGGATTILTLFFAPGGRPRGLFVGCGSCGSCGSAGVTSSWISGACAISASAIF